MFVVYGPPQIEPQLLWARSAKWKIDRVICPFYIELDAWFRRALLETTADVLSVYYVLEAGRHEVGIQHSAYTCYSAQSASKFRR